MPIAELFEKKRI